MVDGRDLTPLSFIMLKIMHHHFPSEELNNQAKELFLKLQNEQYEDLLKNPTQKKTIIDKKRDEWNGWIKFNANAVLNFKNYHFNINIKCVGWHFEEVRFHDVVFGKKTNFSYSEFSKRVNFYKVTFSKSSKFIKSRFSERVDFVETTFEDRVEFCNSEFKDKVNFLQCNENGKVNIKVLDLNKSYFESRICIERSRFSHLNCRGAHFNYLICDSEFDLMPDFSQSIFDRLPDIKDKYNWSNLKIGYIKAEDETKFRFFKDYFLKKNNHEKEQKYFKLEMIAKSKKVKWYEKILYWLYGFISNYGLSVGRPIIGMIVSCITFWIIFMIFDTSGKMVEIFNLSLIKTIFPVTNPDNFKVESSNILSNISPSLLAFQSVINILLIFLLILGIRNKFKIK